MLNLDKNKAFKGSLSTIGKIHAAKEVHSELLICGGSSSGMYKVLLLISCIRAAVKLQMPVCQDSVIFPP